MISVKFTPINIPDPNRTALLALCAGMRRLFPDVESLICLECARSMAFMPNPVCNCLSDLLCPVSPITEQVVNAIQAADFRSDALEDALEAANAWAREQA